jgi:hypothetical protein
VTYEFTTKVSSIDVTASGFPASLSGVSVNDPITGRIQYEANSPAAANTTSGVFQLATYYPLTNVSVSINVAGAVFNTWNGTISAFVWNNDPTSTSPPGVYDGLLFVNITSPNDTRFKIGNLILSANTFSDESLPKALVTGFQTVELGTPNSTWLDGDLFNLTQVSSFAPGDYNGDGAISTADYNVWRSSFASSQNLAADGNGNQVIDAADYVVWRNALNMGAGSLASINGAIPEPTILALLLTGSMRMLMLRSRIRRLL